MKLFPFIILLVALMVSCTQRNSTLSQQAALPPTQKTIYPTGNNDSIELLGLLKNVFRWHAKNQDSLIDFAVIVKDSIQTGLNYTAFNKMLSALKQTNYFSTSFIDNYTRIADYINKTLTSANPKYLNEINFPSQDADPWTGFQDDFPEFWDELKITDYKSDKNTASLVWKIQTNDWTSEEHAVGFSKENNQWKVASLDGFDVAKYTK
jgi:hypothetical protein